MAHPSTLSVTAGESFYFRVNGVPLFMKGANLIPLRVMRTDVGRADVRALVDAAAAAHMNVLRVWGGGHYQVGESWLAAWFDGRLVG